MLITQLEQKCIFLVLITSLEKTILESFYNPGDNGLTAERQAPTKA